MEEDSTRPGHPSGNAEAIEGGSIKKSSQVDDKDRADLGGSCEVEWTETPDQLYVEGEEETESADAGRLREIAILFPPPE